MKSVAIYYFSGTGNTSIVADMIKDELSKYQYEVDLIRIEDVLKNNLKPDLEKYDFVALGSPVIAFGAPKIMLDFIRILPGRTGKKVVIFRTAGGVVPTNYNSSKAIMRRLNRKGFDVTYERIFSIGSNWVVKFSNDVVQQLYKATRDKVSIMCKEILSGERRILKTGIGLKIAMESVAFISTWALRLVGKDYYVNKSCTHCGLCIKNCPSNNIHKRNEKIKFGLSCNCCMRCVYSCPQNAIKFRLLTFFPVKGGYDVKKTLSQKCICDESKDGVTPPFFNDYIKNDAL